MAESQSPIALEYEPVQVPVNEVHPNDWNPNFMASDLINALVDNIQQNSFIGAIVIQKYNERLKKENVIIDGEHRWAAMKKLGAKTIPTIELDVDENKARVLTIRLNRERGELLPNKVGDILRVLSPENDVDYLSKITAIDAADIQVLMDLQFANIEGATTPKKPSDDRVKIDADKNVQCPSCGTKFQVYYK